jgi:serine/threonine protein kinase
MSYVGRPYCPERHSPSQLAAAVRVAIATIGRIFVRHGILHRDLSRGNLLIAEGPTFKERRNPWGGLVDFDHAADAENQKRSGAPERTGTLAYMALNVLSPSFVSVHCIWYDIESVFWLLYLQTLVRQPIQRDLALLVLQAPSLSTAHEKKLSLLRDFFLYEIHYRPPQNDVLWELLRLLKTHLRLSTGEYVPYDFRAEPMPTAATQAPQFTLHPPSADSPFAHTSAAATAFIDPLVGGVTAICATRLSPTFSDEIWCTVFPPSCAQAAYVRKPSKRTE